MPGDGSALIKWPDDENRFRLGIGELRELQDKCNAGPMQIFNALGDHTWRIDYTREVIRLGLIGGGKTPQQALALIGKYFVPPYLMAVPVAQTILFAALVGDPNDSEMIKKLTAAIATDDSASRPSTDQGPSLDGHHDKSINAHFGNLPPQ